MEAEESVRTRVSKLIRGVCAVMAVVGVTTTAVASDGSANIVFIAGPASHGPGEHEHPDGCKLLAQALNESTVPVHATVSLGWPGDDIVAGADSLVIYSDGLDMHVANDRLDALRQHVAKGGGLVVMHFALEASPGELADFLLETVGGRFETEWSVNPMWDMTDPLLGEHEVANGVKSFDVHEEYYYHLRLREDIVPVLRAVPPESSLGKEDGPRSGNPAVRAAVAKGEPQVLAWVFEGDAGSRAFGYTGGHFHRNWTQEDVRRLVLNAIVWSAGLDVPADGVESALLPIPRYSTIEEAIARGDLEDVRLHVEAYPERVHKGKHPSLSPLQQAILRNKESVALFLLEAGADPNQTDASQRTLLHLTVDRDSAAVAAALLERGAEPDHLDKDGWTPLHHAAARDRLEVAKVLLAGGADPMTLSERGGTPLHEAAASGSADMLNLLLDHDVDPTVVSKTGVTALDIAREYENSAAIEILQPLASSGEGKAPE